MISMRNKRKVMMRIDFFSWTLLLLSSSYFFVNAIRSTTNVERRLSVVEDDWERSRGEGNAEVRKTIDFEREYEDERNNNVNHSNNRLRKLLSSYSRRRQRRNNKNTSVVRKEKEGSVATREKAKKTKKIAQNEPTNAASEAKTTTRPKLERQNAMIPKKKMSFKDVVKEIMRLNKLKKEEEEENDDDEGPEGCCG
jgi:hypothetical protein